MEHKIVGERVATGIRYETVKLRLWKPGKILKNIAQEMLSHLVSWGFFVFFFYFFL